MSTILKNFNQALFQVSPFMHAVNACENGIFTGSKPSAMLILMLIINQSVGIVMAAILDASVIMTDPLLV